MAFVGEAEGVVSAPDTTLQEYRRPDVSLPLQANPPLELPLFTIGSGHNATETKAGLLWGARLDLEFIAERGGCRFGLE